MDDLRQQLAASLQGRLAIVGLGNRDRGDDGVGLHLVDRLGDWAAWPRPAAESVALVPVGTLLESRLHELTGSRYDRVLFVDAVELRAPAGSAALVDRRAWRSLLPQVSTHRLSLSLAAELIEADSSARVSLLGIQPGSLRPWHDLTAPVRETMELLAEWIIECDRRAEPAGSCLSVPPDSQDAGDQRLRTAPETAGETPWAGTPTLRSGQ